MESALAQSVLRDVVADLDVFLTARGFWSKGLEYRRQRGHVFSCLAIQEHSSEPMCCVDLGVHLDFLPVIGGSTTPEPEAMTVTRCEIRRRLTPRPDLEDFWWRYHENGAREELVTALEKEGLPFFERLESFPECWQSISLDDLRDGSFSKQLPGVTRVRAALLLARVHSFLGDSHGCRGFAAYGLEIAPAIASGPKKAFRELLAQESTT
jgi:hypothetical protein